MSSRRSRAFALLGASIWIGLGPAGSTPAAGSAGSHRRATRAAIDLAALPQPTYRGLASPADTSLVPLGRAIQHVVAPLGGAVGVAIHHVETGQRLSLRGDERFPMASVYKLPIALQLLHRVACDEVSLDYVVPIGSADLRSGSGWIRHHRSRTGQLTVRELLEAMIQDSDNTASDLLLRLAGGPMAVTERLRLLGIDGVRVDRYEVHMSLDYSGVEVAPPESTWTLAELARVKGAVPQERKSLSATAFLDDPRDTASPDAMADLLLCIWRGEALGADETSRLLEILERTRTGSARLRGKLPFATPVAHKTGTWSSMNGITAAVNDVGIIELPGGAGHLAIAVFIKGSNRSPFRIERSIANIARAAFDHWTAPSALVPALSSP